jgi:hypothetical protein
MAPRLSFVEAEARQLVGRFPEAKQRALQKALVELCEARWREIRGPEPATILAHKLWAAAPPLAELFADLHAAGDAQLDDLLDGLRPARALALLVLAEIERGDAEGVHVAHEAMMSLESPAAGRIYEERVALALRGSLEVPPLHRHSSREPLWKALAIIAAHTGRHDVKALEAVIELLGSAPRGAPVQPDKALERLREALDELGVRFVGFNSRFVHLALHGRPHKPVSRKRLADLLAEVRRARLA